MKKNTIKSAIEQELSKVVGKEKARKIVEFTTSANPSN